MPWFSRPNREPGLMAVSLAPGLMHHAFSEPSAGRGSTLSRCGSYTLRDADAALRASRELRLERYQCTTLLDPGEYQLLMVDAPNVPPPELKSAIRWSVKDLLDFHIDDATVDVLDVPRGPDVGNRPHPMFAVGARNETIQATVDPATAGSTITNTVTGVSLDQTDSDATADTLSAPITGTSRSRTDRNG